MKSEILLSHLQATTTIYDGSQKEPTISYDASIALHVLIFLGTAVIVSLLLHTYDKLKS